MKKIMMSAVALTAVMGSINTVSADESKGINIFKDVTLKGQIRPRYEFADIKDNNKDAAQAFTTRLHLVVSTPLFEADGLSATVGLQSVGNFGFTNYNPESPRYDTILDPQQSMLSEASIDYKIGKTALHVGRSQINLDNERFIGTVGWRQSERSYDTFYVANSDIKDLDLLAAYVFGYAGVGSVTTNETSSVLLHVNYKLMNELSITGYGYLLASISDTYGAALTGNIEAGGKFDYRAEFALQKDPSLEYKIANVNADAYYYNLDLGANISGFLAGVNYEVLSGKSIGESPTGKTQFSTPLGTNHKFNGWADMFLGTPTGGLQDANVRLGYTADSLGKFLLVYHDFKADKNMLATSGTSNNLGTEIDAVYSNKIPGVNGLSGLVKFASYLKGDAIGYTRDKQVAWVQLDYQF